MTSGSSRLDAAPQDAHLNAEEWASLGAKASGVARGLSDEGWYSTARAFRAVAASADARATSARPRASAGLEEAARQVTEALATSGEDNELAALIAEVADAVPPNERAPAALERLFVCRLCGHTARVEVPEACPDCHAGELTFEEILPIYYLEPVPVARLIVALAATPGRCSAICEGIDDDQARIGTWPAIDVMAHIRGAEKLLVSRAVETLELDDPPRRAGIPASEVRDDSARGLAESLLLFGQDRARTVERFEGLSEESWSRTRHNSMWGDMTIVSQLSYLARHEQSHLADLYRAVTEVASTGEAR